MLKLLEYGSDYTGKFLPCHAIQYSGCDSYRPYRYNLSAIVIFPKRSHTAPLYRSHLENCLNLKTAVGNGKVMQDFDSELVPVEGHIPQVVKDLSVGTVQDQKIASIYRFQLPF